VIVGRGPAAAQGARAVSNQQPGAAVSASVPP
jgi:hypothetical protein